MWARLVVEKMQIEPRESANAKRVRKGENDQYIGNRCSQPSGTFQRQRVILVEILEKKTPFLSPKNAISLLP